MIRSSIKKVIKKILGIEAKAPAPAWAPQPVVEKPRLDHLAVPVPGLRLPPGQRAEGSRPLTREAVEAVIEDSIRPALQADGGDILLVALEGNRAIVRLTGACQGCSSSTVTLKAGVEALLKEEFPTLEEVVQEE